MNIQEAVQSQYLAALKMLKEAIVKCPPSTWDAPQDKDRFWFKAQHALYWSHRYLQSTNKGFVRWKGHRAPEGDAPISKPEVLGYLAFIKGQIREHNAAMPLETRPGSGGFRGERLESAIASLRHVQQHTGELYERLGSREGALLHWTEQVHRKKT